MINCKPLAHLKHIEIGQIIQAMHCYRDNLKLSESCVFDISFKNILNNHCLAKMDGMQMKSIIDALNWRAMKLMYLGEYERFIYYRCLSGKIVSSLKVFQEVNGPKINKNAVCTPIQTA
ncbi:hypothetical protein [Alkalihalobacterium alkalinitrilicum]|uniref:hypothetical protein n=1 Tax=Alkalihalobacterium alkalinitrilicum TaxID=427920 RepID=UPI00099533EB|nr:hypothetical protein [Alkalihalobacterium alkalinitrilicum]